jgi:hypothetical protein
VYNTVPGAIVFEDEYQFKLISDGNDYLESVSTNPTDDVPSDITEVITIGSFYQSPDLDNFVAVSIDEVTASLT